MWPAMAFCTGRDASWEFSNNQHLRYFVYSSVFESAQLASEQVPFKQNVEKARNDFPVTHDTFRRK